ncbi:hypothetical protein NPX13_g10881 [Xylaria arbuscula]|uniref:C2H2-type domain-containing protein n=1 Tax=Xylaria arbuscula TaxID=114810 RepID=A0A9W8TG70_9PEZI|nr:hypothetical protein NPX13_g10881 [Xylaria arbuscula]
MSVIQCEQCPKRITKANWARHKKIHINDGIDKFICNTCDKPVSKSNLARHVKSNGHQEKLTTTLETYNTGYVARSAESWYQDFVTTFDGPLAPLSDAYRKEIERADGLSDLQPRKASMWTRLGLRPPELVPADECWAYKPPLDIYMTELLCGFNMTTTIFSRGGPRQPLEPPPMHKVIEQLVRPDATSTYYATNMTAKSVQIKIPDRLHQGFPVLETNHKVTTNITPRYSSVDLHVGRSGVAWVNAALCWQAYQSHAMFIELQGLLEGGELCIQTESQALYLPAGCIHGTITLQGGIVPGIMFTTAECLKPSLSIWNIDTELCAPKRGPGVTLSLLPEDISPPLERPGGLYEGHPAQEMCCMQPDMERASK